MYKNIFFAIRISLVLLYIYIFEITIFVKKCIKGLKIVLLCMKSKIIFIEWFFVAVMGYILISKFPYQTFRQVITIKIYPQGIFNMFWRRIEVLLL